MFSTDALVLLLFHIHNLVENEIPFGANRCNSGEDKRKSSCEMSMDEKRHISHFPSQEERKG